ncbi:MAG: FkbM family methyltransferase [Oscillospiraceae bacterium]|nr:FkbM family methyltransferase [Oscillospiraceae bacterium]
MGDGALKILARCREYGIKVSGIFASDEFVRGKTFEGFPVRTLKETEEELGDFVILLCFAAFLPDLMEKIRLIAKKHPLLIPDVPVFGGGLFSDEYVREHAHELQAAYDLMADEQSRHVFRSVVNFKLSGRPELLTACESSRDEVFSVMAPGENERFLDLGAYDGDTVTEFLSFTNGKAESILALEPDPKNFRKLTRTASLPGYEQVQILNAGIWEKDGILRFDGRAGRSSSLSDAGKIDVPVRSIDSLREEYGPFTFIKMDVEGAEREALLGARRTLSEDRPKLIFSGYHRTEDIFALPLLLHELNPGYRILLRHHPYFPAWETNFSAV